MNVMVVLGLAACVDTGLVPTGGPPAAPPDTPPSSPDAPARSRPGVPTADTMLGVLAGAPPEEPSTRPADFLFEEGTVHVFDLTLDDDALRSLRSDPRTDVPATFTYGDRSWEVGVHIKGSYSMRTLSEKPALKIDFGEFVADQRFFGLRRLTLNNMVQDPSMIREHVVYRAYAAVGVPAPRHGYAQVRINGEPYGIYGVLDAMDGRFAKWAIPEDDDGWLYEGGNGADLLAGRAERFHVQATGEGEPHADLEALVEALDDADDVMDVVEARFHPSAFHMWATDIALGHTDGYVRRRNNYLVYHGTLTDTWWMIPWGNDQAVKEHSHPHEGFFGRMLVDCQASDACLDRLDDALRDVADTWEALDLAGYAAELGERLAPACAEDPRREDPCEYDDVVAFFERRPAALRESLD
ncbi:MAG: CotH kinase family protein [Myxococcota bacterium]